MSAHLRTRRARAWIPTTPLWEPPTTSSDGGSSKSGKHTRARRRVRRMARQALAGIVISAAVFFIAFATASAIDAMQLGAVRADVDLRRSVMAVCTDAGIDHDRAGRVQDRALQLIDARRRARAAGLDSLLPALDAQARTDLTRIVRRNTVVDDVIALVGLYTP